MTPVEILAIVLAGLAAGTINAIVGSGSLITFPTLLAFGYSPVVANVTNNIGVLPGSISGAFGYRRELVGQRSRVITLSSMSLVGGATGSLLVLAFPGSFAFVVPWLILLAVVLVAVQPRLTRFMARRKAARAERASTVNYLAPEREHPVLLLAGVFLTGIYGGYFGAAQGVILMAILGIFVLDNLQRLNAVKNVLAGCANAIAAVLFAFSGLIAWPAAVLLAIGSTVGGFLGAWVARRLSPTLLRGTIIIIGTIVALKLLEDQYHLL